MKKKEEETSNNEEDLLAQHKEFLSLLGILMSVKIFIIIVFYLMNLAKMYLIECWFLLLLSWN